MSSIVPSEYVPVAVNCSVRPAPIDRVDGSDGDRDQR